MPDPRRIKSFATRVAFEKWLAAHHNREPEIWLKIHKKHSRLKSVTPEQALDICLCWGCDQARHVFAVDLTTCARRSWRTRAER